MCRCNVCCRCCWRYFWQCYVTISCDNVCGRRRWWVTKQRCLSECILCVCFGSVSFFSSKCVIERRCVWCWIGRRRVWNSFIFLRNNSEFFIFRVKWKLRGGSIGLNCLFFVNCFVMIDAWGSMTVCDYWKRSTNVLTTKMAFSVLITFEFSKQWMLLVVFVVRVCFSMLLLVELNVICIVALISLILSVQLIQLIETWLDLTT